MTEVQPEGNRRIDRVLRADFLTGLSDLPLEDVRALRREAEQEEVDLSYLRRLVQGRLDLIKAELARRVSGDPSIRLVDTLSAILADESRAPARGSGRHLTVEPSRVASHRRRLEALVADSGLSDPEALGEQALRAAQRTFSSEEAGLSERRRDVQRVMDAASAEITRRYREGEADVDALLASE